MRIPFVLFLIFLSPTQADFYYPDFATVCDPAFPCSPDFEGSLSCCLEFFSDDTSELYINSGAHFQTCAQAATESGEVPGLKGRDAVFSKDTAEDPQISITQLSEYDYAASPRVSLTSNWTRSVFEEVVRRRDELRQALLDAIEKLRISREEIERGLEPDSEGQLWLIITMQTAEANRIRDLYNVTLARDAKLFQEHAREYQAIFPRNDHQSACDNRIRLTPAAPARRGSIWYKTMQTVTHGFETTFRFQLSARNRFCRQKVQAHADQMKGVALTYHYDECLRMEWNSTEWTERAYGLGGGDGFAFVIQGEGPTAVGRSGNELGYGGITDSVAIEFDMYNNKELEDVNDMHVAVHTGGCRLENSGSSATLLSSYSQLRGTNRFLQDGDYHTAKIQYSPGVDFNPDTQPNWSSSAHLQQFVKSDGIGTLRVFVDDMATAVINVPLSLKYAMRLTGGQAYVGFTASTGSMWQNQDILEWKFLEYHPDPEAACPVGITSRAQCLQEKSWPTFQGQTLTGSPYLEPGGEPWTPEQGSVCTDRKSVV